MSLNLIIKLKNQKKFVLLVLLKKPFLTQQQKKQKQIRFDFFSPKSKVT